MSCGVQTRVREYREQAPVADLWHIGRAGGLAQVVERLVRNQ